MIIINNMIQKSEGKQIFMIPIDKHRTIAIIELDLDKLIIKYRNIGENFDIRIVEERNITYDINTGRIGVLKPDGEENFYFNIAMTNPINGMINELIESGILKSK